MSTLVNLHVRQPEWVKHLEHIFVGKDVLELLSSAMYIDPLSMYREYVQNSADAFEHSQTGGGHSGLNGRVDITINQTDRSIVIRDNGPGLKEREFYEKLTAIGGSAKRGTRARGFRGVGRLAGLGYCQELIFRSRPMTGTSVFELRWDSRKVRSLLRSADAKLDLATIIRESIERRTLPAAGFPAHFFEVELRNVIRHRDDRLLNPNEVHRYLSQVSPVPFHPDFRFGQQITEFLLKYGVMPSTLHIEINDGGQVFRPHRDFVEYGGKRLRILGLATHVTDDRNGEPSALSWILDHEYLGAIPRSTMISGWRMRCGDIQIGESDILEEVFPEARFNSWTIAETHVIDKKIIPNGRRDNFEHSTYFLELVGRLAPLAKQIAHQCRTSSIRRNTVQRIETELSKCEESLAIATKDRTPEFVIRENREDVSRRIEYVEKALGKQLLNDAYVAEAKNRVARIQARLNALPDGDRQSDALADFTPTQRNVLKTVIEVIHSIERQNGKADALVAAVLKRLRTEKRRAQAG